MNAPTSLEALKAALESGVIWNNAPMAHGELDWTSLPTFGGGEPDDTREVWSWDADNVLVGTCADDLEIEPRD